MCATTYMDEAAQKETLQNNLQTIYIGESHEYINSLFGVPVIEEMIGSTKECYYKLDNAVLRCVYENDSLVAFIITVNECNIYEVTNNLMGIRDLQLLEFTYYDFSTDIYDFTANVPANNVSAQ